jgi:hypothetical protein
VRNSRQESGGVQNPGRLAGAGFAAVMRVPAALAVANP